MTPGEKNIVLLFVDFTKEKNIHKSIIMYTGAWRKIIKRQKLRKVYKMNLSLSCLVTLITFGISISCVGFHKLMKTNS